MNGDQLAATQFEASGGVGDWRALGSTANAWFSGASHAAGAALIARVADTTDRLPDMDLRATGVRVRITELSDSAAAQARAISAAARDLGLAADPSALQDLQLVIDALDKPAVTPFWRAVLGYEMLGADALTDPMRRDLPFVFQQQDAPRPLRNRLHVDVARPQPRTLDGLQAARSAGAQEKYVGEYHAALADAEGNEVDVIPIGGAGAATAEEVQKAVDRLGEGAEVADWRVLFGAMTYYPTDSPTVAAKLATCVAKLADDAGFPLLVDIRPDGVTIDTGKDQWEDDRFPPLAPRIQAAARDLGLVADETPLRFVQVGIDAVDIPAVRAFWRAVLRYEYDPREHVTDIYDPRRLNPPLFFQEMSAAEQDRRAQRNRMHLDVYIPSAHAQALVDIALAAGGRIVNARQAPAWWTLADPEGNELDIITSAGGE